MKMKKLIVVILLGLISLSQLTFTSAQMLPSETIHMEDMITISPQWDNVNNIDLYLYFENSKANCSGLIRALSGTTKIAATFKLERKTSIGWTHVKSWIKSSSTSSLSFFETYAVSSGYTYRLSLTANVTRNGLTETISTSINGDY